MSDIWYYADRQQQQQGPLATADIAALFRQRRIDGDSLVWCEGLPEWQPLSRHYEAFGISASDADPGFLFPPAIPPPAPPVAVQEVGTRVPAQVVQAGFARRFGAFFIDSLILSLSFYAVLTVLVVMAAMAGSLGALNGREPSAALVTGYLLMMLLYYVVAGLYYALQESGPHQATLGKRALGIKVTDSFGQRLSFSHALGRWAAAFLSHITLYIGFLMAAFTERKQALHDLIAGTFVVDRWAYTDSPEKQSSESSGCLIAVVLAAVAFFLVFMLGILAAIAIPAYQDYTIRAKVAEAVMSAAPAKVAMQEFIANTDRCPRDAGELGLEPATSAMVRSIEAGELEGGRCSLQIELMGLAGNYAIDGKQIWLELQDNGEWRCSSNAPGKYLPANCR